MLIPILKTKQKILNIRSQTVVIVRKRNIYIFLYNAKLSVFFHFSFYKIQNIIRGIHFFSF